MKSNDTTYLLDNDTQRDRGFFRRLSSLHPRRLHGFEDIVKAAREAQSDDMWIILHAGLASKAVRAAAGVSKRLGALVLFGAPKPEAVNSLLACFRRVVLVPSRENFLPPEEMAEVLQSDNKAYLFIGGVVDHESRTLTLWRGNLAPLVVPLDTFKPSGGGTTPDFNKFSVMDFGQTVKFGEYEASAESLLVENDSDYRRILKERRMQEDKGFGPSLRRLRMLKGLAREDFRPVSSKTIARIEQGESGKLRRSTLNVLAKRLGVPPDEIQMF
jgi:hypothetical protein